jgi:hypothetical protein
MLTSTKQSTPTAADTRHIELLQNFFEKHSSFDCIDNLNDIIIGALALDDGTYECDKHADWVEMVLDIGRLLSEFELISNELNKQKSKTDEKV